MYSKDNFSSIYGKPSHNGAYLVLNSWGTSWGNAGYYYISYDDSLVERTLYGVITLKEKDYDNIYQHDVLGSNQAIGYDSINTAYMGNVFKKGTPVRIEDLSEISFQLYSKANVK